MMLTALFLVWLQMSAPTPCQSAKLYYDGVLVDEEPHCGLLNQVINMPTALDDITRAEFAEAAQRAADETDGKIKALPMCDRNNCQPNPPDPEPVDVPAVQEFGGHIPNVDDRRKCVDGSRPAESGVACLSDKVWTCKEKSRILQFSEDGKKHCIKF